jgi:hypothetical protein
MPDDDVKWSTWLRMPKPESLKNIVAPKGPGVYQVQNRITGEKVLFGISGTLQKRMRSLMPAPFGSGTRNNSDKRDYVLENHQDLDYRFCRTATREKAAEIESTLKWVDDHIFNT